MLCKRHCTGVKPAVNYFGYAMHGLPALGTGNGDSINVRTMQFHRLSLLIAAQLIQLLTAAYRMQISALALPNIQRSTPVTITGNPPVLNVLQPVAETAFSDGSGNPVNCLIIANQILPYSSHLDEPGFSCIINQRRVASPAEGIIMLKLRCSKKLALCI